jgi:hypothetical protein
MRDSDSLILENLYENIRRNVGSSYWGNSYANSQDMTGYASTLMGGFENYKEWNKELPYIAKKDVKKFLNYIHSDVIRSEENLYHGFKNKTNKKYKIGEIIKIPLMATTGDIHNAGSYSSSIDQEFQKNPTIFEFLKGIKIVPYNMVSKKDMKEYGFSYRYNEALTSGEFQIISERLLDKKESSWAEYYDYANKKYIPITIPIYTLKQIKTYNPINNTWEPV